MLCLIIALFPQTFGRVSLQALSEQGVFTLTSSEEHAPSLGSLIEWTPKKNLYPQERYPLLKGEWRLILSHLMLPEAAILPHTLLIELCRSALIYPESISTVTLFRSLLQCLESFSISASAKNPFPIWSALYHFLRQLLILEGFSEDEKLIFPTTIDQKALLELMQYRKKLINK